MKHAPTIDDWLEDEDDALTVELFGALGELRPDPEDFAAGVAERVAAGEPGLEPGLEDGSEPTRLVQLGGSPMLRWAAGVVPPVLLPKGASKLGLAGGTAAASKLGLKLVPGLAMLPIATVVMVFVTLFVALRELTAGGRTERQVEDRKEAALEVAAWWRRNLVLAVLVFGLILLLWVKAPHEAAALLLLGSTLVLIGVVGRLARAGLATRAEVGKRLGGFLVTVSAFSFQLQSQDFIRGGPFGSDGSLPLVSLGAAVVLALALAARRGGLGRSLALTIPIWGLAMLALFGVTYAVGKYEVTLEDARAWVEAGGSEGERDAGVSSGHSFDAVADVLAQLAEAGEPPVDLARFRAAAHAVLDATHLPAHLQRAPANRELLGRMRAAAEAGEDLASFEPELDRLVAERRGTPRNEAFNRLYTLPLLRFDLARPSDREAWFDAYRARKLVAADQPDLASHHDEIDLRIFGNDFPWPATLRDQLAESLLAAMPLPEGHGAVQRYVDAAGVLELLDRGERAEELTERAHAALLATWTPTVDGLQAAFPGSASLRDHDGDGDPREQRLSFVWVEPTATALRALRRWGVPDGIDLGQLEGYLEQQVRTYRAIGTTSYTALAAASLANLRALSAELAASGAAGAPQAPRQGVLELLLRQRLLLAALLLVAFALAATLRAPTTPREAVPLGLDLKRLFLDSRAKA